VTGIMSANAVGDDIEIYADAGRLSQTAIRFF